MACPSSPVWVETSIRRINVTEAGAASSPSTPTTTLTGEGASRPPLYPHGMRASAATYVSFVSTNMSTKGPTEKPKRGKKEKKKGQPSQRG